MPVLIGQEVRVFLLQLVYEIAPVGLAGLESEKRMVMKKLFRLGRVLGVRGCYGDSHWGMRCVCLSLRFMILMNGASMRNKGMVWEGSEKHGVS
jgi:hypothetical protein